MRYWGIMRPLPEEMSWDEAVKLKTDIAGRLSNASTNDYSFGPLLRELLAVSLAIEKADEYIRAVHLVRLSYCLYAGAIILLVWGGALTVKGTPDTY